MKESIIAEALQSIRNYLTPKQKRSAVGNFILLLIASILDVFGLASLVPVIMAASEPSMLTTNKYFAYVYQALGFTNDTYFLIFLISSIFLFFLVKNLFTVWVNYRQVHFTARLALNIFNRQFAKYTNLPFYTFNEEGSAYISNNVLYAPQLFVGSIVRPLFVLLSDAVIIVIIIIGIFIYQPMLFLILTAVLLPSSWITYSLLKNKSERLGRRLNELRPESYMILLNTFNGFIELTLANKIENFKRNFIAKQEEMQRMEARSYLYSLIPVRVIEMVAILGVVVIFIFSLMAGGANLIAIIGLFVAAAYRIMPSLNRILTSLVTIKQNKYIITELRKFQEFECPDTRSIKQSSISFHETIVFKNIHFSFPNAQHPTLYDINLEIKKGEKVGFIGSSGSGKTTLMNVLLRFYKQQQGDILIDGISLSDSNKLAWYNMVGYVKQDTFLMESSIKDNITLGDTKVDEKKLEYAIEKSSLREFIDGLAEGVDTLIGERGSKLSGGQKQRIGIARALYKNAQVLLLDEATSALDNQTEREISEAIGKLSDTDITILIIAHRITTLRDCDKIYELKNDEIVREHSYEDVIRKIL